MRFPGQAGLIAGLTLTVGDLARSTPLWRGLLHPLGYGRTSGGPSWCLWAREGAQILIQEGSTPKQSAVAGIAEYLADFVPVERLTACSPVTFANRISCPALLVHGAEDDNVPVAQARIMTAANPRLRLRIVDGAGHGTPPERWAALWPETLAFLKEHLLPAPSREPND